MVVVHLACVVALLLFLLWLVEAPVVAALLFLVTGRAFLGIDSSSSVVLFVPAVVAVAHP